MVKNDWSASSPRGDRMRMCDFLRVAKAEDVDAGGACPRGFSSTISDGKVGESTQAQQVLTAQMALATWGCWTWWTLRSTKYLSGSDTRGWPQGSVIIGPLLVYSPVGHWGSRQNMSPFLQFPSRSFHSTARSAGWLPFPA